MPLTPRLVGESGRHVLGLPGPLQPATFWQVCAAEARAVPASWSLVPPFLVLCRKPLPATKARPRHARPRGWSERREIERHIDETRRGPEPPLRASKFTSAACRYGQKSGLMMGLQTPRTQGPTQQSESWTHTVNTGCPARISPGVALRRQHLPSPPPTQHERLGGLPWMLQHSFSGRQGPPNAQQMPAKHCPPQQTLFGPHWALLWH
jgi:hypothetical protein